MTLLSHHLIIMNTGKKIFFWLNITCILATGFLSKEILRDSWLALVLTAFTHVGVSMSVCMVLLHKCEQHCMNIAMYLLILFAFLLLSVYDLVFGLLMALWEWGFPFCPKRRVNIFVLIFMWQLNIHQNISLWMCLYTYSSKKLYKKPLQKGKVKCYFWPVLENM